MKKVILAVVTGQCGSTNLFEKLKNIYFDGIDSGATNEYANIFRTSYEFKRRFKPTIIYVFQTLILLVLLLASVLNYHNFPLFVSDICLIVTIILIVCITWFNSPNKSLVNLTYYVIRHSLKINIILLLATVCFADEGSKPFYAYMIYFSVLHLLTLCLLQLLDANITQYRNILLFIWHSYMALLILLVLYTVLVPPCFIIHIITDYYKFNDVLTFCLGALINAVICKIFFYITDN